MDHPGHRSLQITPLSVRRTLVRASVTCLLRGTMRLELPGSGDSVMAYSATAASGACIEAGADRVQNTVVTGSETPELSVVATALP
jgi:hypothetical protein